MHERVAQHKDFVNSISPEKFQTTDLAKESCKSLNCEKVFFLRRRASIFFFFSISSQAPTMINGHALKYLAHSRLYVEGPEYYTLLSVSKSVKIEIIAIYSYSKGQHNLHGSEKIRSFKDNLTFLDTVQIKRQIQVNPWEGP